MKRYITRARLAALSGLLFALAAGCTVTLVLSGPDGQPITTITVLDAKRQVTKVEVPAKVADQAAAVAEDHLRSENPPGVSNRQLDAIQDQQDALAATDQLPILAPDAAPSFPGCVTRIVSNRSSRRGVKPRVIFDHYTVSANRPGWDDVWAIVNYFDRPISSASSTFVLDGEGHCAYIVPITEKAWTQAAANPIGVSIEIINSGREPVLLAPAGKAKLAQIHVALGKLLGIPMQRAVLRNCVVVKPGITDHNSLGPCGGGHHDVLPFHVDEQIAAAKAIVVEHAPVLIKVYTVTIWKPGLKHARRIRTDRPGMAVARATKQGYTRISIVRVKGRG